MAGHLTNTNTCGDDIPNGKMPLTLTTLRNMKFAVRTIGKTWSLHCSKLTWIEGHVKKTRGSYKSEASSQLSASASMKSMDTSEMSFPINGFLMILQF